MRLVPLRESVVVQAWFLYLVLFVALAEFLGAILRGHWVTVALMVVSAAVGYWAVRRGVV